MRLSELPVISHWRNARPAERRFLILVPLTGLITGFAAVALIHLVALVQRIFWGSSRQLLRSAEAASPLHRVLALALGGALVGLVVLLSRRSVRGHGTA